MNYSKLFMPLLLPVLLSSLVLAQQSPKRANGEALRLGQRSTAQRQHKILLDEEKMLKIAGQIAPEILQSTVRIVSGQKNVALGTIVSSQGHILTKFGSLKKGVKVVIENVEYEAQLIGVHRRTDLAMLKIDSSDLRPIKLTHVEKPGQGNWLISIGSGKEPAAMGVLSGQPEKRTATLGVMLDSSNPREDKGQGVSINRVLNGSPAKHADLLVNDIIRSIDGVKVKSVGELANLIQNNGPYDQVELSIVRGSEQLTIPVVLAERYSPTATIHRRLFFEHAFAHDSKLLPNQCGGPVVNLNGQIVGINVLAPTALRRPGRIPLPDKSNANLALAVPIDQVIPIIESLKSGKLAPDETNRTRIDFLVREATEIGEALNGLKEIERQLEDSVGESQELAKRLREQIRSLESARQKSRLFQRKLRLIEGELERLRSGF